MIVRSALAFVCSLLLYLQQTDGFSTFQTPSLWRSKNIKLLPSSIYTDRLSLSSPKTPMDGRSVVVNRNCLSLRATKEESEGSEGEVEQTEAADDKKIAGRKNRLNMGYKLAAIAYLASSAFSLYSLKHLPLGVSLYYVFGGGQFTMAVILYILKGAAGHDRLSSDTYKRLNIAAISFALIQLAIPIGPMRGRRLASLKVPAFLAIVNGIKGYGYGCLGWDKSKDTSTILTDVKEGIQSTLKGLTVAKAKSAGYLFGTLLLTAMTCLKCKELCSMVFFSSSEPTTFLSLFTRFSKFARFGLLSTIMYTLKDASDRDRLSGTTFIQLNFVAAAAFLSISLYLFPTYGTLSVNAQILTAAALSAMTAYNGVFKLVSK